MDPITSAILMRIGYLSYLLGNGTYGECVQRCQQFDIQDSNCSKDSKHFLANFEEFPSLGNTKKFKFGSDMVKNR